MAIQQSSFNLHEEIKEKLISTMQLELTKEGKQVLENFKQECRNYITGLTHFLDIITPSSLASRIVGLSAIIRDNGSASTIREIEVLSHNFETKLNQFLGRAVPITHVDMNIERGTAGTITILSQQEMISLYRTARKGTGLSAKLTQQSLLSHTDTKFGNQFLAEQLKKLQKEIDQHTRNLQSVFTEALRRWKKSPTMNYAKKHSNQIPNIYWYLPFKNPKIKQIGWSQKIGGLKEDVASGGQFGQQWVNLVINNHNKVASNIPQYVKNEYNSKLEEALQVFVQYQADSVPGILIGDIKVQSDSRISLAVKQGRGFNAASIGGNIVIAFAFLKQSDIRWLQPELLKKQLEEWLPKKLQQVDWENIYAALIGQEIKGVQQPILIDLI